MLLASKPYGAKVEANRSIGNDKDKVKKKPKRAPRPPTGYKPPTIKPAVPKPPIPVVP